MSHCAIVLDDFSDRSLSKQQENQLPNGDSAEAGKGPETPKKTKKKSSQQSDGKKKPKTKQPEPQQDAEDAQDAADDAQDAADDAEDAADAQSIDATIDRTFPPGKHDLTKDFAMQSLSDKKKMPSELIGEQNTKEIEENREKGDDKGSLRINISLDLDVEVHLSARIKGDITIGLL